MTIKTIGRLFLVVALVLPITCYADVIVALASGSLVPSTTTYPNRDPLSVQFARLQYRGAL
jgi:hypothetical protein